MCIPALAFPEGFDRHQLLQGDGESHGPGEENASSIPSRFQVILVSSDPNYPSITGPWRIIQEVTRFVCFTQTSNKHPPPRVVFDAIHWGTGMVGMMRRTQASERHPSDEASPPQGRDSRDRIASHLWKAIP